MCSFCTGRNAVHQRIYYYVFHVVKEFIHPSNVTWKPKKEAAKETVLVLAVVIAVAIVMIAADSLIGYLFDLAM